MDLFSLVNLFQDRLFSESKVHKARIMLKNDEGMITFPITPADLPAIELPQNNEVFSSLNGDMYLVGQLGLRTIKLDLILPDDTSRYSFASGDNASTIINFITKGRASYRPFRLVITRGHNTYCNMAVLIDTFTYYKDNIGDYHVTINCTEFRHQGLSGVLEA